VPHVPFNVRRHLFIKAVPIILVKDAFGQGDILADELLGVHVLDGDEPAAA